MTGERGHLIHKPSRSIRDGFSGKKKMRLEFLHQGIDGFIHGLAAGILVSDHALGIEDVDRGPTPDSPIGGDGATGFSAVPK